MKLDLKLGRKAVRRRRIEAEYVRMYRGITAGALNALVAERMPGPGSVFVKQELEYLGRACVGDVQVTAKESADAPERVCLKGALRGIPGRRGDRVNFILPSCGETRNIGRARRAKFRFRAFLACWRLRIKRSLRVARRQKTSAWIRTILRPRHPWIRGDSGATASSAF